MTAESRPPELEPDILHTLNSVRRLLRKYVWSQTLLMIVCWILVVFWLGGLLDYFPVTTGSSETPRPVRIAILVVMGAGSLWALLFWGLPRLVARIRNRSIALLIENQYPALENHLVTVVELSEPRGHARSDLESDLESDVESDAKRRYIDNTDIGNRHSGAESEFNDRVSNPVAYQHMLARVHESLSERIGIVQPNTLFNWLPVWRVGLTVFFGLVFTVTAAIAFPDWMSLWSQRLFALSNEPWPRTAELRADGIQLQLPAFTGQLTAERTMLPFVEGIARVPSGVPVLLQIASQATSKQVPEVCTLFYRSEDGTRGRANLRRVGSPQEGWQQFAIDGPPLDGITSNMNLDVVGLDARLRDLQLVAVDPAVITSMRLHCIYPKYLLDSLSRPATESIPYRSGIRIPAGTFLTLEGQSSSPLRDVQFLVLSASDLSDEPPTIQSVQPRDSQFSITIGLLEASQVIEIRLLDQFGLSSEQIPRYVITVQEDTVPDVSSRLAGIGNAITRVAKLPVQGSVLDDNGVASVRAELASGDNTSVNIELELADVTRLDSEIDLRQLADDGQFEIFPGDTIGLVVTARDYHDLNDQEHVGRGQPQQLAVVAADELLVILDRQELELRQRLELIVSELEQLRELLLMLGTADNGNAAIREARLPAGFVLAQVADPQVKQAKRQRMFVLRAQQSVLQGDKSEQELGGVASRVENLRQQLENNRIDSLDRQNRLQQQVFAPLVDLLATDYQAFSRNLSELQTAALSGSGTIQAKVSVASLDSVLIKLEQIKESMLDIESFNEIIDLVRGLLDDQDKLIEQTEKAKRDKILELLR